MTSVTLYKSATLLIFFILLDVDGNLQWNANIIQKAEEHKESLLISSEVTNQGKQGHSSLEHMEVQVDLSSASFMLTLCLLLVQVL